jgi:hypothetical protein
MQQGAVDHVDDLTTILLGHLDFGPGLLVTWCGMVFQAM